MASREAVAEALVRMRMVFGGRARSSKEAELELAVWCDALADIPDDVLRSAAKQAVLECERMPVPLELRRLCAELRGPAVGAERALPAPADAVKALNEFIRYAPGGGRWAALRVNDRDGAIRRAAATAWLAAVPCLDRYGDDRRWVRQKVGLAERLMEALEVAAGQPGRVCPGGDLWPHVCRVPPGQWRDETGRRWCTARELRERVVEPTKQATGPLAPHLRRIATDMIRRHARAGVIDPVEARQMIEELGA